jgi:type IX secretion system PorP/SprF family membrane protein
MRRSLHILFIVFCIHSLALKAQDIHFSEYNGSILNLSPANTGFFDGDYRFNAIYRSQWSAVPVPYRTFSIGGDMRYQPKSLHSDVIGIGILINTDKAGDAYYTQNQIYLSGSYIHKMNSDSTFLVGAGFGIGINNNNFNYNKMTFDNQFDGFNYNGALNTGEKFTANATTFGDFNVGLSAQYTFHKVAVINYAFGFNHLSSPVISYQGNPMSKLDNKRLNYLSVSFPINANWVSVSEVMFSHQGKYKEFVPGTNLKYIVDPLTNNTISAGLYLRKKDALIARLGYTFKMTTCGVSYDLNMSKFIPATNRRGGIEFYVIQILRKNRPFVAKKRACPVYM